MVDGFIHSKIWVFIQWPASTNLSIKVPYLGQLIGVILVHGTSLKQYALAFMGILVGIIYGLKKIRLFHPS